MTLPHNTHTHTLDGYGCVILRNNRCDGYGCPISKNDTVYNIYDTYYNGSGYGGSGLKHAKIIPK